MTTEEPLDSQIEDAIYGGFMPANIRINKIKALIQKENQKARIAILDELLGWHGAMFEEHVREWATKYKAELESLSNE